MKNTLKMDMDMDELWAAETKRPSMRSCLKNVKDISLRRTSSGPILSSTGRKRIGVPREYSYSEDEHDRFSVDSVDSPTRMFSPSEKMFFRGGSNPSSMEKENQSMGGNVTMNTVHVVKSRTPSSVRFRQPPVSSASSAGSDNGPNAATTTAYGSTRLRQCNRELFGKPPTGNGDAGGTPPAKPIEEWDSPERLTRTNFRRLKHELEIHEKYEGLANKIVELSEQGVLKAKDKNLRKMIHTMSSFVFVLVLGVIVYCNYIMLAPHLNAVSMAGLLSLVLNGVHSKMTDRLDRFRDWFLNRFRQDALSYVAIWVAFVAISMSLFWLANQSAFMWYSSFICMSLTLGIVGILAIEARSLVAGVMTILVICGVCVPLFFALIQCVYELEVITRLLLRVIEDDELQQTLVDSIVSSSIYQTVKLQATAVLGQDFELSRLNGTSTLFNKDEMKADLRQVAKIVGVNLEQLSGQVMNVASNISNLLWAFTTFSTTLYYLLHNESPWAFFNALSPLSPEDNADLYQNLKKSTAQILLCSLYIFLIHSSMMYVLLHFAGVEVVAIPSFACGVFAVMPLWGTYVLVLPISFMLWARGAYAWSILIACSDLFLVLIVDAKITSKIPGDSHFVGISIVAGLYAFGLLGFLYGPLLVCTITSLVSIYLKYLKKPLHHDMYSPNPQRKLFI